MIDYVYVIVILYNLLIEFNFNKFYMFMNLIFLDFFNDFRNNLRLLKEILVVNWLFRGWKFMEVF